ncbi:helix-turn-helix domain-containing protein [Anaerocolumna sedimenticola]|uniref:Helix-turn-helix domain-containing protein n=1 Tax=Anaerocolumna sedimenticola TaxID=2696063 RepID=A0A6P1THB4_9FIRM|nr:helix-turn-helix transcriptional regulator [Anaerocolumna sedimenticola]QHQ60544.1 helix-turn-helix domain-containing protein [Anaerocolumna sedimenticola]
MNYEHFGNLLQELRIKYHMSREKLAQNICTPKQIYRIERGDSEPSIYLLHQLSIKFNLDLNEYYKMHFTSNTIAGLEGIKTINAALESGDMTLLNSLVYKYEKQEEFKKGSNLQHIYYGKALCSALLDKDYKTSLDYCFKGIQVEYPEFNISKIDKNTYSNVGIALLNCISQNYFAMNQYNNGMKVLFELLNVLETYVLTSPYPMFQASQFSKKIYQAVLCNISASLLDNGEIENALDYVEKGIQFSIKENNLRFLPDLLLMKFKIFYYKKNYEVAKEYYNRTIYLYKIINKENKISELEKSSKAEYPEIFTE